MASGKCRARWRSASLVVALLLTVSARTQAQRAETIAGTDVAKNTERVLSDLTWHRELDAGLATARAQAKPMVWIQMVGDLDSGL
ncbi:MAG: hypothetical protein ACKVX7_15005 [Planctomycetota bacterium]